MSQFKNQLIARASDAIPTEGFEPVTQTQEADIKVGSTYRFAYPYWGADEDGNKVDTGALPDYESRRGALVTVTRQATEADGFDPEVLPQFYFRDTGGWEGHGYACELITADASDEELAHYVVHAFG